MGNLSFKGVKVDKKYFLPAFIVVVVCAIICGIVLFELISINVYFRNFAKDYIYNVFNFKNSKLIFPHLLSEIFYLCFIFLICRFTKFKYLSLLFVFIRVVYIVFYSAILITINSLGGVTVAIFVFIPSSCVSLVFCYILAEFSKCINHKLVFLLPVVLALINTVILLLLINVLFRVIIVIV